MKNINGEISNEAYKIISDYKLDKGLNKLIDALDKILLEYKQLKEKKK